MAKEGKEKFLFYDEDGELVELELKPSMVWERQIGTFFQYRGKHYRRAVNAEIERDRRNRESNLKKQGEAERGSVPIAWNKPLRSFFGGVHPSQAKEFTEEARKNGNTGVYYTRNGDLVAETRRAYNAELKRRGLFNKDAGYGDYAGR